MTLIASNTKLLLSILFASCFCFCAEDDKKSRVLSRDTTYYKGEIDLITVRIADYDSGYSYTKKEQGMYLGSVWTKKDGKLNGILTRFATDGSGSIKNRTTYDNGKKNGPDSAWDKGFLYRESFFKDGKEIWLKRFYRDGKILSHEYNCPGDLPKKDPHLCMQDVFDDQMRIVSQVRGGWGFEHSFSSRIYGYKQGWIKGIRDRKPIQIVDKAPPPLPKDPQKRITPMDPTKLLPWDVEKYGKVWEESPYKE